MATYPVGGEWVFKRSGVGTDPKNSRSYVSFILTDAVGHRLDLEFKRTPKRCTLLQCTIYSSSWHTLVTLNKDDKRLKTFGITKVVKQYQPLVFLMT